MKLEISLSDSQDALYFHKDIPNGVRVSPPPIVKKGFGEAIAIGIVVSFVGGVPTNILASWLYDKFAKCKSSKITINKRTINFDKGAITQIIEEAIEKEN